MYALQKLTRSAFRSLHEAHEYLVHGMECKVHSVSPCGFNNGFVINIHAVNMDNLKLTELQMYSIITVTSSFLMKEEDLYFSSSLQSYSAGKEK